MIVILLSISMLFCSSSSNAELSQKVHIPRDPRKEQRILIRATKDTFSVQKELSKLSLAQKVGQILMLSFTGYDVTNAKYLIKTLNAGGFIVFSYNIARGKNAKSKIKTTLDSIRNTSISNIGIPPFISIDQEGGKILRLRQVATAVSSPMSLGATRSAQLSYLIGKLVGVELEILGINFNLAPVLDTNKNPKNKIIGVRAFGDDYNLVASLGSSYIKGLQSRRIIATAKHFPGHGETEADSHYRIPVLDKTAQELLNTDWLPFKKAIDNGVSAVMVGHIAIPKIDPKTRIATTSKVLISHYLKQKLGFKGVVITDDMMMLSASDTLATNCIKAINAGADILILSGNTKVKTAIYKAILNATRKGIIPIARINDAVSRILYIKHKMGLYKTPESFDKLKLVGSVAHYKLAEKVAERSVTVVKGKSFIDKIRGKKFLVLSQFKSFYNLLLKQGVDAKFIRFPLSYSYDVIKHTMDAIDNRILLVSLISDWNLDIVRLIRAKNPNIKILAVSFDSPYYYSQISVFVDAFICLYSYRPVSLQATAKFISNKGTNMVLGTLPVKILSGFDRKFSSLENYVGFRF